MDASTGKHSKYLAYENMIAGFINQQYFGDTIEEDLITILSYISQINAWVTYTTILKVYVMV